MARRGTRKNGGSGLLTRLWSPFKHLFMATGESVKGVTGTSGKIVKNAINAARKVGNTYAKHGNAAVRNLTRRRGRRNGNNNCAKNGSC
jgi:hypothetical protein